MVTRHAPPTYGNSPLCYLVVIMLTYMGLSECFICGEFITVSGALPSEEKRLCCGALRL